MVMQHIIRFGVVLAVLNLLGETTSAGPLITWDRARLVESRARIQNNDPALQPAYERLLRDAEAALERGPWSVTDKPFTPPSGDKRDYMSVGPYWWPNPDTEDGLPYVRRDGEVNPERNEYDSRPMGRMAGAVRSLALAWFFSDDEKYAEHASHVLRVWFLDEQTGMNPHLEYGQAIPGRTEGRGIGIIDTVRLFNMLDAVALLRGSDAWTDADHEALQNWFRQYLRWLLESDHGKDEARTRNNHATWYDAQVAAYALFISDRQTARRTLKGVGEGRIATQIEPDGRQPHELARTRGYSYTVYNLRAFIELATLGERVGVDVWGFTTEDGRSIRGALQWFAQYAASPDELPYEQITPPNRDGAWLLYRRAAAPLDVPQWKALAEEIGAPEADNDLHLLYPPEES